MMKKLKKFMYMIMTVVVTMSIMPAIPTKAATYDSTKTYSEKVQCQYMTWFVEKTGYMNSEVDVYEADSRIGNAITSIGSSISGAPESQYIDKTIYDTTNGFLVQWLYNKGKLTINGNEKRPISYYLNGVQMSTGSDGTDWEKYLSNKVEYTGHNYKVEFDVTDTGVVYYVDSITNGEQTTFNAYEHKDSYTSDKLINSFYEEMDVYSDNFLQWLLDNSYITGMTKGSVFVDGKLLEIGGEGKDSLAWNLYVNLVPKTQIGNTDVYWQIDKYHSFKMTGNGDPKLNVTSEANLPWYEYLGSIEYYSISDTVKPKNMDFWFTKSKIATVDKIPSTVESMNFTFAECYNLKSVIDLSGVQQYMNSTFARCYNLQSVQKFPNYVATCQNTFNGCTALTTFCGVPSYVVDATGMYYNCTAMQVPENSDIKLSKKLKKAEALFYNCKELCGNITINSDLESYSCMFYNVGDKLTLNYGGDCTKEKAIDIANTGNVTLGTGSYTLTLVTDSKINKASQKYKYDVEDGYVIWDKIEELGLEAKDKGYSLVGYVYPSSIEKIDTDTTVSSDITITITAEKDIYTIIYNLNDGKIETENPATYTVDTETFKLNNPTKDGYLFTGWTGSNGEEPQTDVEVQKGTTGNLVFTANWEKIEKPSITKEPESIVVSPNEDVEFTVEATGTRLTYQWYIANNGIENGTAINGANDKTYKIEADKVTSELDSKYFYCEVSGYTNDKIVSKRAKLSVAVEPTAPTFSANISSNSWANKAIEIELVGSEINGNTENVGYKYSLDGGVTWENYIKPFKWDTDTVASTIIARAYNKMYPSSVSSDTRFIVKYDSTSPTINSVKVSGKEVTIEAFDATSGVESYGITTSSTDTPTWSKDNKLVVGDYGVYYAKVRDYAGNVETYEVSVDDLTRPDSEIYVPYSVKKLSDVDLSEFGYWVWEDEDVELEVGKTIEATAKYTGEDADKYENTSVKVKVTREECKHINTKEVAGKEATCVDDGYTTSIICKDCEKVIVSSTVIKKTGHNWDTGVITKEATAGSDGIKTYTCQNCRETKEESIKYSGTTNPGNNVIADKITVGQKISYKGGQYKVIKENNKLALTFVKALNKKAKTVTVYGSVKVKGKSLNVTSISDNAFKGCTKLNKAVIGKNIKVIGKNAFKNCVSLKTVTLKGKSITEIKDYAFYGCKKLTSVTITEKVSKIGKGAFQKCDKIGKLTIKSSKLTSKKVGKNAFKINSKKLNVRVPKNKLKTYKSLLKTKGISKKAVVKKI